MRVLVTRPQTSGDQACELTRALQQQGVSVLHLALTQISPVVFVPPANPQDYDWVFFTSGQAVKAFFEASENIDPVAYQKTCHFGAVGPQTAKALLDYGITAAFIPKQYDARSAAVEFLETLAGKTARVLWPCGNLASPDFGEVLLQRGVSVDTLRVYETRSCQEISAEARDWLAAGVDVIAFTSTSAIEVWAKLQLPSTNSLVACIGPSTQVAARRYFGRADIVAAKSTLADLARAILEAGQIPCLGYDQA